MKRARRSLLAAGALLSVGAAALAQAPDAYPIKPIRIVVAAGPGGMVDVTARLVAQKMAEKLGQPVVIENQGGAGTLVGVKMVKAAAADGYTLLATSNTIAALPAVKLDPGFDLARDFTGIGAMVRTPWFMIVGPTQPDRTIADFVARAKARPESMSFASGGVGTTPFLAAESFLRRAGLDLLHVPYRGNGPAVPDLISGRVTMMFDGVGSSASKVRGGQVRALGVTSAKRLAAFPDIPTIAEQGWPDFTSYVTVGLLAPAATPKDIVKKLSEALQAAVASKDLRERFDNDGVEPLAGSSDDYNAALRREVTEMAKLAADLGLSKD